MGEKVGRYHMRREPEGDQIDGGGVTGGRSQSHRKKTNPNPDPDPDPNPNPSPEEEASLIESLDGEVTSSSWHGTISEEGLLEIEEEMVDGVSSLWEAYSEGSLSPVNSTLMTRDRQDSDLDPVLRRRKQRAAKAAVGFVDEDDSDSPYLFLDSPPHSPPPGGGSGLTKSKISLFDSSSEDEEEGNELLDSVKITPVKATGVNQNSSIFDSDDEKEEEGKKAELKKSALFDSDEDQNP